MRIVHNRSIPNVDVDRLKDSLDQIHEMCHTRYGITHWEESRRGLINMGIKGRMVAAELDRRGEPPSDCWLCTRGTF